MSDVSPAGSTDSVGAVEAAVAVASRLGLYSEQPMVLRDAWHVLVHLRPLPIVARVSSSIPFPQGPRQEDVIRELRVAAHAVRAGAPVIPPADEVDPGPHRHGGRIVTLWRYVDAEGDVDPRAAGEGLRAIHETLRDYDDPLPRFGHPNDTLAMLDAAEPSADVELLRELASRELDVEGQALHGDSHLFNCLPSRHGLLWHDFETACHGPREYDLAALVIRDQSDPEGDAAAREALAAYGPHDAKLIHELIPIYAAWVYASFLLALPRRPELAPVLRERLAWLRREIG